MIEAAGVTHHAYKANLPLLSSHRFSVCPTVRYCDFHPNVLAGINASDRLFGSVCEGAHRITASTSGSASVSAKSVPDCCTP